MRTAKLPWQWGNGWLTRPPLATDGRHAVFRTGVGTVERWDLQSLEREATYRLNFEPSELVLSPEGRLLAAADSARSLTKLWDVRTSQEVGELPDTGWGLAISPTGSCWRGAVPTSR